jgi:predicted nucleotidyltransferase
MGAVARVRATLEPVLAGVRDLDLAFVFGSVARGQEGAESDVDLAIDPIACAEEVRVRAARVLGREVDVADLRAAGIPLMREILRDGVVVFERRSGLAAAFRSRALLATSIDGPWYDRMRDAALRRIARGALGGSR